MSLEKLYTIPELAEYFQVDPRTIKNWLELGRFDYGKFGGVVRVLESEVERFIQKSYRKVVKGWQLDKGIAIDKAYREKQAEGYYAKDMKRGKR